MRELLEKEFFPYVVKPGRYSGGEPGQIVKEATGRFSFLLAYPDKYEFGQSQIRLQTLYHLINRDDRFLCERLFAPERDSEKILRNKRIPLFSLESHRPVREFDLLGFMLTSEMQFTNLLNMIDLSGLPLHASDRSDDDPIVLAAGPATCNPEPLAPFVDVFFIGECEEGLPEVLSVLIESGKSSRLEKLRALAKRVQSIYCPQFNKENCQPENELALKKIQFRTATQLRPDYYPDQPLTPLVDVMHNNVTIELSRDSLNLCGICGRVPNHQLSVPRQTDDIIRQMKTQIAATGLSRIMLLSDDSMLPADMQPIVQSLSGSPAGKRLSVDLPPLYPGAVSTVVLRAVAGVRRSELTLIPAAGSKRLRTLLGRTFQNEAVHDAARMAFDSGYRKVRLQFTIGLPTETEKDLAAIAELVNRVRDIAREFDGKRYIIAELKTFRPRPHTPFQWDAVNPAEIIRDKIKFSTSRIKGSNVQVRHDDPHAAIISCALARGDQTLATVIETAFQNGARFDSWPEEFNFTLWSEAFQKSQISLEERCKEIPFSYELPWSHVTGIISTEQLHELRTGRAEIAGDFEPRYGTIASGATQETEIQEKAAFGRGKRRLSNRSSAVAPTRNRMRIHWGKTARYRYMSHLDNLRLMERAIRRADLPVAYSQGNHPSMKLSLGPPLPLGFTSEAEYLDITLESILAGNMIHRFKEVIPEGISISEARPLPGTGRSLSSEINRSVYTVPVTFWNDRDCLQQQVDCLLAADELLFERKGKKKTAVIDLRASVYDLRLEDDQLVMLLGLGEGGYVRASELCSFMTAGMSCDIAALPFHRLRQYRVNPDGRLIDPMEL